MGYAAMFAVLALVGTGTGATVMAADFGHGAPDDVQAQNRWTGPADFGYGPGPGDGPGPGPGDGDCTGPGDGHGYGTPGMGDADGDGIPNGQDDDWVPPEDGSGYQFRHGKKP